MKMLDILKKLMELNGDDAYSLERKSGVPQPTTQRFLSGKHKSANSETVKRWAAAYSVTESQMRGDIPIDFGDGEPFSEVYIANSVKLNLVPIVGKGMGGLPDRLFTDEGRPINGHDEYTNCYSHDISAFIVRIDGESMIPAYKPGNYALVEPNTEIDIGDDVLIKTVNVGVMLKTLKSRKGGVILTSYNDPEEHVFLPSQIIWMYYVANSIPKKKIKQRV